MNQFTILDCLVLYMNDNLEVVLNNGRITEFVYAEHDLQNSPDQYKHFD